MARFTFRKSYLMALLVALFLFFAPVFIEAYYPEAAPVAAAFIWVTDSLGRALSAAAFFTIIVTLVLLVRDLRRWLTGATPAQTASVATPAELEAGVAADASEADTNPSLPNSSSVPEPTLTQKLVTLAVFTYFLVRQCYKDEVMSLERPALDNALAALLYIFHGLEVLFAMFLVLCLWTGLKRSRSASAAGADATLPTVAEAQPPAVEVLFDEGGKEEYVETEKA
ncbi:hypothetical protein B0H16DRAFT_1557475 [Mycena metata]|uniref:Uncharacterized protein n=1 Tax=Mycena metata TaxID=1033252 RepID=A0AAD7INP3_9AGAR|nr:hypothetical protein B0H16DRAFT_1557475 [Mycena metata]